MVNLLVCGEDELWGYHGEGGLDWVLALCSPDCVHSTASPQAVASECGFLSGI